ncbi:hypothetical protein [Marinobacter sp.]|uniref:hypothetical protein n=1 Tax=Marinobacter sp. TaxID=50741 RepID=UPI00384CD37C
MRTTFKACRQAMLTALANGLLALALMLLVEFAVSGTFHIAAPYLWAGLLIWLVVFTAQLCRQLRLCRCDQGRERTTEA